MVTVRCQCGRFMRLVSTTRSTYVSGGILEYGCRCGATAYLYTSSADDQISGGVFVANGAEFPLRLHHDDRTLYLEWRPA